MSQTNDPMIDPLVVVSFRNAISPLASRSARLCVCDQGSDEWHRARLGIPTGSNAGLIVTPNGKMRDSESMRKYAVELAMERVYGRDMDVFQSRDLERGTEQEPLARDLYAQRLPKGTTVEQVGFVYRDDTRTHGQSPDGCVVSKNEFGLLEIKCRARSAMANALLSNPVAVPVGEMAQMQFGMWVTGAAWCDYVVYFHAYDPIILVQRVVVDPAMHEGFAVAVPEFCKLVDRWEEVIRLRIIESRPAAVARIKEMA